MTNFITMLLFITTCKTEQKAWILECFNLFESDYSVELIFRADASICNSTGSEVYANCGNTQELRFSNDLI
jgi:hypothetical protein